MRPTRWSYSYLFRDPLGISTITSTSTGATLLGDRPGDHRATELPRQAERPDGLPRTVPVRPPPDGPNARASPVAARLLLGVGVQQPARTLAGRALLLEGRPEGVQLRPAGGERRQQRDVGVGPHLQHHRPVGGQRPVPGGPQLLGVL